MDTKPKSFARFQMTDDHEMLGALVVGRIILPVGVMLSALTLIGVVITILCAILSATSGDGTWWRLLGGYVASVMFIFASVGVLAMASWMWKSLVRANSADVRDREL